MLERLLGYYWPIEIAFKTVGSRVPVRKFALNASPVIYWFCLKVVLWILFILIFVTVLGLALLVLRVILKPVSVIWQSSWIFFILFAVTWAPTPFVLNWVLSVLIGLGVI